LAPLDSSSLYRDDHHKVTNNSLTLRCPSGTDLRQQYPQLLLPRNTPSVDTEIAFGFGFDVYRCHF